MSLLLLLRSPEAGAQTVTLSSGIATAEGLGEPTLTPGTATITIADGVGTGEAFGEPLLILFVVPDGIATVVVVSEPVLTLGEVTISFASGIATGEAFGPVLVYHGDTPPNLGRARRVRLVAYYDHGPRYMGIRNN